jgi:hypothetical protein
MPADRVPWLFSAQLLGGILSWPLTLLFWHFAFNPLHYDAYYADGCESDLSVSVLFVNQYLIDSFTGDGVEWFPH